MIIETWEQEVAPQRGLEEIAYKDKIVKKYLSCERADPHTWKNSVSDRLAI